ncbi:MAG: hypothetical protein R3217_08140 [Gammaproteobacteria bacterium]|nr:hypothetical protein [Gammaproteobacteria bacterium]
MKTRTLALAAVMLGIAGTATAGDTRTQSFDKAPPYANMQALGQRLMHGLAYRDMAEQAAKDGIDLRKFSIDPREREWLVHVPAEPADNGRYGILVWLPDEDDFELPAGWADVLDEQHLVLVAPLEAGNGDDPIFIRAAAALFGMNGVIGEFPADPARLYVGGQESGAIVAESLALGYGDVFSGALLVGPVSMPGGNFLPVPAPGVIDQVAQRSRFHLFGDDEDQQEAFTAAMSEKVCANAVARTEMDPDDELSGEQLAAGIDSLSGAPRPESLDCVLARQNAARAGIKEVEALVQETDIREAYQRMFDVHIEYGAIVNDRIFQLNDMMKTEFAEDYLRAQEKFQRGGQLSNTQKNEYLEYEGSSSSGGE